MWNNIFINARNLYIGAHFGTSDFSNQQQTRLWCVLVSLPSPEIFLLQLFFLVFDVKWLKMFSLYVFYSSVNSFELSGPPYRTGSVNSSLHQICNSHIRILKISHLQSPITVQHFLLLHNKSTGKTHGGFYCETQK